MIAKTALALTLVGSVAAAAVKPTIPRWISADKHGYGYVLSSYWNGTYTYEASTSFSWDFDYNCARSYAYSYSDYQWAEASYCNNVVTEYTSAYGCRQENVGYVNLEAGMNDWIDDFTISWGAGFTDPVWGLDNYHVLEHKSDWVYLYLRPSDKVIEFIVEAGGNSDIVAYFPSGLSVDNTTYGVYDFELRYGSCANNATAWFSKGGMFRSFASKNVQPKPTNLAAKPRPTALPQLGGVRALFSSKGAEPKAMVNIPDKATFLINKEQVAASPSVSPMSMFKNLPVAASQGKVQSLFRSNVADNKMAKLQAFVSSVQPKSLADDISKQVDYVFRIADTNRDNFLTKAELKAAIIASGERVTDQEIDFVFMFIDSNMDGKISKAELTAFARSQQVNLHYYTKAEKADLIFAAYDSNFDGFLSRSEIRQLLVDAYGYASDEEVSWFFAVVDTNMDGKIDWYEIYAIIQE